MLAGVLELSRPNEAKTRKELIDPALKKAGWDVNNPEQVPIEIPERDGKCYYFIATLYLAHLRVTAADLALSVVVPRAATPVYFFQVFANLQASSHPGV